MLQVLASLRSGPSCWSDSQSHVWRSSLVLLFSVLAPVFKTLSLFRVLLWSWTGLFQQVVHHATHHLPGPASQHLHGYLWDRHLRLHPEPHLLLLLHQVRATETEICVKKTRACVRKITPHFLRCFQTLTFFAHVHSKEVNMCHQKPSKNTLPISKIFLQRSRTWCGRSYLPKYQEGCIFVLGSQLRSKLQSFTG